MSTESIALPLSDASKPPLVEQLHQWMTTVDPVSAALPKT
jgi:hypothetical protein